MKRILLAAGIGILSAVVLFVLAGLLGGACHCMTPTIIFFPYAAVVVRSFSWESVGFLLIALQFPCYALLLSYVKPMRRKILVLIALLALHVATVLAGLRIYRH